jgi:tetratricopeptide (TPR) repeat protein
MELPNKIYEKIIMLSEEGDALAEQSNFNEAIKKYKEALDLLPTPKNQWEASTWL